MKPWLNLKGLVAGLVAFVACPCHLPLTLPLAAGLMAGTGVGTWLVANTVIVYVLSTALFLGSLLLTGKWLVLDAETGELLFSHILGPRADGMIYQVVTAMYNKGTAETLYRSIHIHPTLGEVVKDAAKRLR